MKVIIKDNIFKVKLRTTQSSISEGMMGKTFDDSFNGMLFIMPDFSEQSFWMYNCIIPLDIIMIDPNNVITKIHHNSPECDDINSCTSYKGFGDKVLEVFGGTCENLGIKKGDQVSFSLV